MELHKPDHPGSGPDDSDARVGASIVLNRILSDPPVVVISICGDVDQKDMKLLSSLAEPVTVSGYNRIVFDLHETGWFPDQGIGAFVPFLKLAKQQSGEVVLCGASPEMKDKIELVGFEQLFRSFETRHKAIDYFRSSADRDSPTQES